LKQIGLAIHNYHGTHGRLPFAMGGTGSYSAISLMLPFMEQSAIHASIDFRFDQNHPINDAARMQEIPLLRCPSDRPNPQPQAGGAINYGANKGSLPLWQSSDQNGVFLPQRSLRFADITDGLSSTAAFSERLVSDGNN